VRTTPPSVCEFAMLGRQFEDHRVRLLGMLRRRIGPPPHPVGLDPEEILNSALMTAQARWEALGDERGAPPDYAWIFRIARDTLIEAWRRAHAQCRHPDREIPWPERSSIQLGLGLCHQGSTPSNVLARRELSERVGHVLDALSALDREILWLRHYDEVSLAEAGVVLGITENAATVRYSRAIKRLRTLWRRFHGEPPSEHPR
jgi:RNA polymerase sigma-70 factor (ECF subfamily)